MRGFELIFKLFQEITVQDWLKVLQRPATKRQNWHYQKSELIDLDINSKIIDSIQVINERNFNVIALATNERSQLHGLIEPRDVMTFLVNNYKGEIDFFKSKFIKLENLNDISHFSKNHNLVSAQHTDTLFEVLQKLRENRVSMISIDRKKHIHDARTETVGIVFLTDLMYILRQVNFHEILTQPIIKFVMNLNGTEEDRTAYRERIKKELTTSGAEQCMQSEQVSDYTIQINKDVEKQDEIEQVSVHNSVLEDNDTNQEQFFVFNPQEDPIKQQQKLQRSKKGPLNPNARKRADTCGEGDQGFEKILFDTSKKLSGQH